MGWGCFNAPEAEDEAACQPRKEATEGKAGWEGEPPICLAILLKQWSQFGQTETPWELLVGRPKPGKGLRRNKGLQQRSLRVSSPSENIDNYPTSRNREQRQNKMKRLERLQSRFSEDRRTVRATWNNHHSSPRRSRWQPQTMEPRTGNMKFWWIP